jgi:hypothetical protein
VPSKLTASSSKISLQPFQYLLNISRRAFSSTSRYRWLDIIPWSPGPSILGKAMQNFSRTSNTKSSQSLQLTWTPGATHRRPSMAIGLDRLLRKIEKRKSIHYQQLQNSNRRGLTAKLDHPRCILRSTRQLLHQSEKA